MVINAGQCKPFVSDRGSGNYRQRCSKQEGENLCHQESRSVLQLHVGQQPCFWPGCWFSDSDYQPRPSRWTMGLQTASKGHGARSSRSIDCQPRHSCAEDLQSQIFVCQRGHSHRHDRRPTPLANTPGLGVWNHMYGRTYSAVSEAFIFSPAGVWTSTQQAHARDHGQ